MYSSYDSVTFFKHFFSCTHFTVSFKCIIYFFATFATNNFWIQNVSIFVSLSRRTHFSVFKPTSIFKYSAWMSWISEATLTLYCKLLLEKRGNVFLRQLSVPWKNKISAINYKVMWQFFQIYIYVSKSSNLYGFFWNKTNPLPKIWMFFYSKFHPLVMKIIYVMWLATSACW